MRKTTEIIHTQKSKRAPVFILISLSPDEEHEIIDPQKRKLVYSYMDIINRVEQFGFPDSVPQYFELIITKPDSIYMDKKTGIHYYSKHKNGKEYLVTTYETMRNGRKCFCLNSWKESKDQTIEIINQLADSNYDEELSKEMEEKINKAKSWMTILYTDTSYMGTKRFEKAGIKLMDEEGKIVGIKKDRNKKK